MNKIKELFGYTDTLEVTMANVADCLEFIVNSRTRLTKAEVEKLNDLETLGTRFLAHLSTLTQEAHRHELVESEVQTA